MKNRKTTTDWNSIFLKFEESKLGVNAFCREYKIPSSQFYYWKKRLGYKYPPLVKEKISSQNFISIEEKVKTKSSELTFIISGHKITFSELPEPAWIAKFTKELSREASTI